MTGRARDRGAAHPDRGANVNTDGQEERWER